LAVAFTVRYNALYYPLITALAYLLSCRSGWVKLAGIMLPVLLIAWFVRFTIQKNYEVTGQKQFSIFSGWQLANNALYMFPYTDAYRLQVPEQTRPLHEITKNYFASAAPQQWHQSPADGAYYLRHRAAPLKSYLELLEKKYRFADNIQAWGVVAPTYSTYGEFLIMKYPAAFIQYYIMPNVFTYFFPPLEKLKRYNLGTNEVNPIAAQWFRYPKPAVKAASIDLQGKVLAIFPVLFLLINMALGTGLVWLAVNDGLPLMPKHMKMALIPVCGLILVNFFFSVFASPVVFRYQALPMIIMLAFGLIICEYAFKTGIQNSGYNKRPLVGNTGSQISLSIR
jgi:hypothetical protein